jgi:hypothetical protein
MKPSIVFHCSLADRSSESAEQVTILAAQLCANSERLPKTKDLATTSAVFTADLGNYHSYHSHFSHFPSLKRFRNWRRPKRHFLWSWMMPSTPVNKRTYLPCLERKD